MRKWTKAEVKAANERAGGKFFAPSTMQFFGDTMASWAVRNWPDGVYLERVKPIYDHQGRNMGGVGNLHKFDPDTGLTSPVSDPSKVRRA